MHIEKDENPEVLDIVICTYNNAALLDRTLATISRQCGCEQGLYSTLVVDNNCTDQTASVVQKYVDAGTIPGLRRVVEPIAGLAHARRCGLLATMGEWIAFIDDDNLLRDEWVKQAIEFARAHPRCGIFGGRVLLDWETSPPDLVRQASDWYAGQNHGEFPVQTPAPGFQYLVGAGMVVRRSALKASGWLDRHLLVGRQGAALSSGEDLEICYRIHAAGFEVWYTPDCVMDHFVPTRKISDAYVIRLASGIAPSIVYLRFLCWRKSYPRFVLYSLGRALQIALRGLALDLEAAIGLRSRSWARVKWMEFRGAISALRHIAAMGGTRRQWLGMTAPR